jgi:hypothetical protein
MQYTLYAVPGCLHLGGYNGQLLPHQRIEEGALARIRATKNAYEPGFHFLLLGMPGTFLVS